MIDESEKSGWVRVLYSLCHFVACYYNKSFHYILLLFDLLFDLSVRQFVFLRLSSVGDYPVSPLWHVSRLGTVFYLILLFLPLRSVRLPRSDALLTAQSVYACVLWSKGVGRFSRSPKPGICWPHIHASQGIRHWKANDRVGS